MKPEKYFVTVCVGDCEFNEEFHLKFGSLDDAETAKAILEKAVNVISADIEK